MRIRNIFALASAVMTACSMPRPEGLTCQLVKSEHPVGIEGPRYASLNRAFRRATQGEAINTSYHLNKRNFEFVKHLATSFLRAGIPSHAPFQPAPTSRVLAISSGGQWGAYGAGVLAGLANSAAPPSFDVVTGVSTGALLAPLIFVGDYDDAKSVYTTTETSDVYKVRPKWELLWANSLVDTSPLAKQLEHYITEDVVARIVTEGQRGRTLAVVAVDLDAGEPVVFDLTQIASGNSQACGANVKPRDCIISAMRASAAIPIGFPPVFIDGEMFVDGGLRDNAFVIQVVDAILRHPDRASTAATPANSFDIVVSQPDTGNAYSMDLTLIADTDFQYGLACTGNDILDIAARTSGIAVDQLTVSSFYRLLSEVRAQEGNTERYTFADPSMTGCMLSQDSGSGLDAFNKVYMQCLFQRGCELASAGVSIWHTDPEELPHSPILRAPAATQWWPATHPTPTICSIP